MKRKLLTVVGARPQFIKAGVVSRILRERYSDQFLEVMVHTGQHYDENMSRIFFEQLDLPQPKIDLEVGSGSHGAQTGKMLPLIEEQIVFERPDLLIVYGDTNSTLAAALAAAKLHVPVAHVEAGLRSWNRKMPEEINRVVVDHVSDLLLCPSDVAVQNLKREGVTQGVFITGDVMHDSALYCAERAEQNAGHFNQRLNDFGVQPGDYALATVHRAENTDEPEKLRQIVSAFDQLTEKVIFPAHPRTRAVIQKEEISLGENIVLSDPFSYLDMILFLKNAKMVFTDSGGVQKEAMFFETPCVTLRQETEWTETVDAGWNLLAGSDTASILKSAEKHLGMIRKNKDSIYGSGRSAENVIDSIVSFFDSEPS